MKYFLILIFTFTAKAELTQFTREIAYDTTITRYLRNGKTILHVTKSKKKESKRIIYNFFYENQEVATIDIDDHFVTTEINSDNKIKVKLFNNTKGKPISVILMKDGSTLEKFVLKKDLYLPISDKELQKEIESEKKLLKELQEIIKDVEEKP